MHGVETTQPCFHLMLQPMLGIWSTEGATPESNASTAARASRPVTGTSLPGRAPSN